MTTAIKDAIAAASALKMPIVAAEIEPLADLARAENWSFEEFLAIILGKQAASRESASNLARIRRAHFPKNATLEDFNWNYQPSAPRQLIEHLGTATFIAKAENVVFLGPPGTGKTHLAISLGMRACQRGYTVMFKTAMDWVTDLSCANSDGTLATRLQELQKTKLLIIDELGYLPLDADAANLLFQLVSARYETGSIIITSNLEFARWGETLSDTTLAAALIDRLIHHAEIISLKGESYRVKSRLAENKTR